MDGESRQLPRLPVRRKPERRPRHDSRRPAVCDPYRSGNRLAPRHPARHRRAEHRRSAGDAPLRPARRRRAGRRRDPEHGRRLAGRPGRRFSRRTLVRQAALRGRRAGRTLCTRAGTAGRRAAHAGRRRRPDRAGRLPQRAGKPARHHGIDPRIPPAAGRRLSARRHAPSLRHPLREAPRGRNAATAAAERRPAVRADGGPRADDRHFVPSLFRHDPHRRQPGPVRRLCGHRPQQKPADDRRVRRSDRLRPHNGRHRTAGVGFPVRERGPEGGNGRLRESLSRSGRDGQRPSGRTRRPRQRRTAQKHRHQLCHAGLADGREGASAEHRDLRFVPRHGQPKLRRGHPDGADRRHGHPPERRHQRRRPSRRGPLRRRQQPDRPAGRRQPDLHDESAGRRQPVGQIRPFGRDGALQSARDLPEDIQDHAGQLCRLGRKRRRPGLQHYGGRNRPGQRLRGRAGFALGEFQHLHQYPQYAERPRSQLRTVRPRRPHDAEPAQFADGRTAGQSGDEPAHLQHLHRSGNDRQGQHREPAQLVHTERAEPVGAEQPEGRGPQLRHRLLRRGRPERPADRLFVPAVQKSLQQPRARRHRGQVQHRRRPVAEPEGEPDRRHFARIHADQTRQHVSEGLPPHRLRKHPRRRDHRDGRGLRHPEETAPAGRPPKAEKEKQKRNESDARQK